MRAIIVDDEPLMIHKFMRLTQGIKDLNIVGSFESSEEALQHMAADPADLAFLDIELPVMDGITLAKKLREIRENVIIVFVTAYEEYIREANAIGGDYYLVKPYTREVIELMMENLRLISLRQHRNVYIQTFGRFLIKKNGKPVKLTGKAKEILALIVTGRGKEISNEEIYHTIWEGRPYSNKNMTVYYNAVRRLRNQLAEADLSNLLISTARGQMVNTDLFDCDYYAWKDGKSDVRGVFEGEFLSEYSWGEEILSEMALYVSGE
ncbi:MAG: response regulator [Bacillota bacterium]|nr:response regulator [Bacillota bacterium]